MNKYPSWWNQTITIYNKFEDPQTRVITWHRTVVDGSFWKYIGNKINIGETVLETDTTLCRIRKDERFLEKYLWDNVPNDSMANYFTLAPGDIIARGTITDTINEYSAGVRASDFLVKHRKLQGCIVINKVTMNTDGERCDEHYLVKGV